MLSVVFGLPVAFGLLVWRSYRSAASRAARGETLGTPGALRWTPGEERAGAAR
jgi:hypothetical protein